MTALTKIVSAHFGMFHCVITNKIESKHNYTIYLQNLQHIE